MDKNIMKQLGIVQVSKKARHGQSFLSSDVAIYVPFKSTDSHGRKSKVNFSFDKASYEAAFGDASALCFGYAEKSHRLFIWPADLSTPDAYSVAQHQSTKSNYVSVLGLYDTLKNKYFTDVDKKNYTLEYSSDLGEYFINLKEDM